MRQSKLSEDELDDDDKKVVNDMESIKEGFQQVAKKFGEIELLSAEEAPHGLMEKARTISWLVEQIYVQNLVDDADDFGLADVDYPDDDLGVYDVEIELPDSDVTYYINVKTGLVSSGSNKNDVSKAAKLLKFYHEMRDEQAELLLVNVKVEFEGGERTINLREDEIFVENVAWINEDDIYVNNSNKNLQAKLHKPSQIRSYQDFLQKLLCSEYGILDAIERRDANIPIQKDQIGFDYSRYEDLD